MVYQLDGAVAATVADDGFYRRVAHCPADVADALGHRTGISAVDHLAHIWPDDRLQPPSAQHLGRLLHVLHRCVVRWRYECHLVTGLQIVGFHLAGLGGLFGCRCRIDDSVVFVAARCQHCQACKCKGCGQCPYSLLFHKLCFLVFKRSCFKFSSSARRSWG